MKSLLKALAATMILCGIVVIVFVTISIVRMSMSSGGMVSGDHVAVIELKGMILTSSQLLEKIRKIQKDEAVKAVVLRINSPGGLVAPSQEYYEAIKRLDEKKPVVISMASVAASGGYYAALGGRKIFANPGTLTASIGVIMEFANTEKLYQWAKIDRFVIKAGKLKDVGSSQRQMKPEERVFLQELLDSIHQQFRQAVKDRRKLSDEELAVATDGRIMTGQQALKYKLVDALGGLPDAIADAKRIAKLPADAQVDYPKEKKGFVEKYLLGELSESFLGSSTQALDHWFQAKAIPLSQGWNVLLLARLQPTK